MDAITICAVNYLPFANVLGESFLHTNPNSTFSILVIDSEKVDFTPNNRFRYFSPADLDITRNNFVNMAFYYNVTELSTALKPSALKLLFKLGSTKVVYLDPDIQAFGDFSELDSVLDENSIVLTPHNLHPIPRDGKRPTEADIMGSGTFNLGFIGLAKSPTSQEMLDWWEERLRFDSISDPEEMLFTDQRWIDLVPSYYDFCVLRNSNYNVAYWNLHERRLSKSGGNYFVDGEKLKFFHFSGYRPERPWILSKYVADNPRVVISAQPILRDLFDKYGELAVKQGWKAENFVEYGYESFDNGEKIPSSLRRLYRTDCIEAHINDAQIKPPTDWYAWATSRSPESGNLSRVLFSLWKSRPDLKRRYPDATGTESSDLQNWARNHGVAEKVIDANLIEIGDLATDSYPDEFSNEKGINVAGYLQGEFGLGQSARLVYESALATRLPVTPLNSSRARTRQQEFINYSNLEKIYPLIITIVNADHFEFWINDIGQKRIKKSSIIGVWAWETEDFPKEMHNAFKYVDEIWAVSNFVKKAISKHTKKPVHVFPTPILKPERIEKLDRTEIEIPKDSEYNLFIFDYMSVFNRKNPIGLVFAHIKAFPDCDGPLLVIKSTNGDNDTENREKLRYLVQNRKDILLIEKYLSRNQLSALINECSTYISLHRSEGYGLTMAEAMALGKPVIATGYSGNLDFMNNNNSILIPFKMINVGKNSMPYAESSTWADPDLSFAAEKIKRLYYDQKFRESLGLAAQNSVLTEFNFDRARNFIITRVNDHYSFKSIVHKQKNNIFNKVIKFYFAVRLSLKTLIKSLVN